MSTELIALIAALIVGLIVFQALIKVLKTTISTAIVVFLIVVVLGFFGVGSEDVIQELMNLPQTIMRFFTDAQSQIGV